MDFKIKRVDCILQLHQNSVCLPSEKGSTLKRRKLLPKEYFFLFREDPSQKGLGVHKSKQEVPEIASFVQNESKQKVPKIVFLCTKWWTMYQLYQVPLTFTTLWPNSADDKLVIKTASFVQNESKQEVPKQKLLPLYKMKANRKCQKLSSFVHNVGQCINYIKSPQPLQLSGLIPQMTN